MPAKRSDFKTMQPAGELRKEVTPAERKLWSYLHRGSLLGLFCPKFSTFHWSYFRGGLPVRYNQKIVKEESSTAYR